MNLRATLVSFRAQVPSPDGPMVAALSARSCTVPIEIDLSSRVVRAGVKLYPFEIVAHMEAEAPELTCPECSEVFSAPNGLGAHRFQKHGVAGARSAKGTAA